MKLLIVTQKVDENDQLLGFFVDWIRRFANKFERLIVLCLEKGDYNLPSNVEVVSLGKDSGAGKLKLLSTFYSLLSTCRRDYDAVFVHMNPIWMVLGGIPWKLLGKKRLLWYTSKGVTLKLKIAEKFANKIFTASKESFRLKSNKVIVTGHGIDTELFKSVENVRDGGNSIKILSVGRISPVKNYETLINAAKILIEKGFNFHVTLIGEPVLKEDKKYENDLKSKIEHLKLTDHFNFAGKIDHKKLPQYYQSHDIFVHLSKTGSLDKTILEAMACGITVLSSNDASKSFLPPNLVFDDKNAEELADKIKTLKDSNSNFNLRQYVMQSHNLDNLINKITGIIYEQ